jgi:ATP-dependent Clp protease ATP-binding subunit ClpX
MSTEFVGRIQAIVPLVPLSKEQMLECLLELEDSPILRNRLLFAESNVNLVFDDEYYDEVIEKAIKSGTGTRALNSIVKASLSGIAFEFLGHSHKEKIVVKVTKETVNQPSSYEVCEG